jgi:hypothetical protein
MDLIARAQQKRDWHKAELARIEAFLATAFELESELDKSPIPQRDHRSDADKADAPKRKRQASRPLSGIGAQTIDAAEALIRERGPMTTREMLPLIRAKGIEVGGNDAVATLSARISHKGDLVTYHGKWFFKDEVPSVNGSGQKEAADNPAKDTSAASLFQSNQGGRDGPALAS